MPAGERSLLEDPDRFWASAPCRIRAHVPEVLLAGGEALELAGHPLRVLSVPGHSPAHLAYHADGCLFSGDVLFAGSVGRVDIPGADWDTLLARSGASPTGSRPRRVSTRATARATTLGAELARTRSSPSCGPREQFEAPRGTHDVLPAEQPLWRTVVAEAERLCALAAYRRIDTPTFEDTELFVRTSGEGSDVVSKEMYAFQDRGGRSLTLRPEGDGADLPRLSRARPAPRAAAAEALHDRPMFRYGRPQRGRFREHWQLSVEAIGSDDPASTPR